MPNSFIQTKIAEAGFTPKFYIIYILICRYRTIENFSWLSIAKIFNCLGIKSEKRYRNLAAYKEIISILAKMCECKLIKINQDLNTISYDTGIEIEIISEQFDISNNFTIISTATFDTIMSCKTDVKKDNLLLAYLYVASCIKHRPRKNGKEILHEPWEYPEAFYMSLKTMSDEIDVSYPVVMACMKCLVDIGVLKKKNVGKYKVNGKNVIIPAIYVLNDDGFKKEMQWAYKNVLDLHNIEHHQRRM